MEKFNVQHQVIKKEFSKQSQGWKQEIPPMLSMLADRLPLHQEHTVLDVAAGSGLVSMALSDRVNSITALDMTREMMQQGKALVNQKGLTNIEFVKGFAEALPFADGTFDVVITRYPYRSGIKST